jgi:hypothetical protein
MRKPYLAHLGIAGPVRCWLVDGCFIRNRWDVDFTNGAHHLTRAYVPHDEVWVDREAPGAGELRFLVHHQLHERALMISGVPYLRALERANRRERKLRRTNLTRLSLADARRTVRKELFGRLDDDEVWIVDGRAVRDHFDPNFTQGGHHWRYRFVPRRQIWIDDAIAERELEYTLVHEAHELHLMRRGMSYDDAHERALAVEKDLRRRRTRRFRLARSIPLVSWAASR